MWILGFLLGIYGQLVIFGFLVDLCILAPMAEPSALEARLASFGVDPVLAGTIVAGGWTEFSFREVVSEVSEFTDEIFDALAPNEPLSILVKANIKAAWRSLQVPALAGEPPSSSGIAPPVLGAPMEGSWTEAFPPRLSSSVTAELKAQFLQHYPSEVLTADTMPSPRLLSLVYQNTQKKEFKWVAWKYRMSQARAEDMQIQRASKVPKIEHMALHQLVLDDPPQLEITNQSLGLNALRQMFDLHNYAWSLCQAAHLHRLRAYSLKFLSLLSQRMETESGLRPASIVEAQHADRHIWSLITELCQDSNWSLNDALLEFTQNRGDMAALLQPRPRLPKPMLSGVPPQSKGNRPPKGSSKGGGKSKGGASFSKGTKWLSELWQGSQKKTLCMRYQAGKCNLSDCRFTHKCGYPKPDGSGACGGDHPAIQHSSVPH